MIDVLIEEAEGRGRNSSYARRMLMELYMFQENHLRPEALAKLTDISGLHGISYRALESEQKLRGGSIADQVEVNLPNLDEAEDFLPAKARPENTEDR